MRYSSALVLSTLAVGQAAAANHQNRHASFHARRQADTKASKDINWRAVAYDLNDVDWDKVNWSSVFASPTPTPAAPAAPVVPTVAPEEKKTSEKPAPTSSAEVVKVQEVKTSAAAPSSTKEVVTSSAPAATPSSSSPDLSDLGDLIGDVVSDLLDGVESIVKSLGVISTGKNDKKNNGGIWIGDDGDWKAEFRNDANEDGVIFCWKADGFNGMSLNVNQPEISVGLKPGQKVVVSFAPDVPTACAPAFSDTKLAIFGGLEQTWWEATFGQWGTFDVSRNVNMYGRTIASEGSKCKSNMDLCVFKCKKKNGVIPKSCEDGADYTLDDECKQPGSGGGGGYDPIMDGIGGGCAMGANSETVKVSFS